MLGSLTNKIAGGEPILSETINLRTVERNAKSLTDVQNKNTDVEIGSYPFLKQAWSSNST